MHDVVFIRCRESVDPNVFVLVEKELKNTANEDIKCETLDLCSLNYNNKGLSYFENIVNNERIYYAKEVVLKKKPHIVVTGNDVAISADIIKVCNLRGIPSLVIQHGILPPRKRDILDFLRWKNYLPWRMLSSVANVPVISRLTLSVGWRTRNLDWGSGGATKYAVMGDYYKRLLMSHGLPSYKINVTGYPVFDLVTKYSLTFDKEAAFEKLGLNPDKPVVLFTTEALVEDRICSLSSTRLLAKIVIDSVTKLDLQLIIKVHPREEAIDYEELSKSVKGVTVLKDYDLHILMLLSDVVVTTLSTTGLWGLVYGKPLISITWLPYKYCNIYEKVAFQVGNSDDLSKAIKHVLKDRDIRSMLAKKRNEFLKDYYYKLDGRASKRVAKLVLHILNTQSSN